MQEPALTRSGRVPVSNHQFLIADLGRMPTPPFEDEQTNGLFVVQPGVVVIFTGIHTGNVNVEVEVRHEPAMDVVTDGWDVVVEAPVRAPVGQMRLGGLMADGPDLFPVLTPAGPGYYRLRVYARGRDTAVDLVRTEPTEDYRIVIWPAPPQPAVIHRHADQYGGNPYYDGDPDAWDRDRQSGRNPEEQARDANLRNIFTQ